MGGNAIKNVTRLAKEPYNVVTRNMIAMLNEWYPCNRCEEILSYANKETFGDLDIVIEQFNDEVSATILDTLKEKFSLGKDDYYKNGSTLSFRYPIGKITSFQVDIIIVPTSTYDIARDYFAYNDLGNLLGRISKKLGFKLGHKGLSYTVRDGDYKVKEIYFSHWWDTALGLLGLDIDRFDEGFDELEDIFEFVVGSPYFSPDIFMYHNRNHKSGVRDRKRPTYNKFVEWCKDNKESLTHYPYMSERDHYGYGSPSNVNEKFLNEVLFKSFPLLKQEIKDALDYVNLVKSAKKFYNGKLVMELTGLEGKDLGKLMNMIRDEFNNTEEMWEWMSQAEEAGIQFLIMRKYEEYKYEHPRL